VSFRGSSSGGVAGSVDVTDRAARLVGHVTVDNASLAVTGPLTDTQLRASAVPVDVSDRAARLVGHVTVDNGAIAVTQSTTPWVTQDGRLPAALGQQPMTGSLPVVIASDQTAVAEQATAADGAPALPAVTKLVSGYEPNRAIVKALPLQLVNGDYRVAVSDPRVKAQLGEISLILEQIRDALLAPENP